MQHKEIREEMKSTGIVVKHTVIKPPSGLFCAVELYLLFYGKVYVGYGLGKYNPNDKKCPDTQLNPNLSEEIAESKALHDIATQIATEVSRAHALIQDRVRRTIVFDTENAIGKMYKELYEKRDIEVEYDWAGLGNE